MSRPGAGRRRRTPGPRAHHAGRRAALRRGHCGPPTTGGARRGGGPRSRSAIRSPAYRFLLDTEAGPRWLTAAGLVGPRCARRHRLPAGRLRPAAGLGRRRGGVPDLPGPVRPLGRGRGPAGCPTGPSRATGTPRSSAAGPQTPYQFYGGDLDGITEHLDHIERARRQHGLPDADLPGPVQPPLRRRRLRPGRSAARRRRGAGPAGRRGRTRAGMRLLGDITTNHCGDAHPWFRAARPTRRRRARDVLLRRRRLRVVARASSRCPS